MRIRLCFLIRQLNEGGAQRQLIELARNLDRTTFEISIVTFYEGGRFAQETAAIPELATYCLKKRGRWDLLLFVWRLIRTLRLVQPHVLHGYLGTANMLAVLVKPLIPRMRVVWGVRSSNMDASRYDWLVRVQQGAETRLARFADLIIMNSHFAKEHHVANGFPEAKCAVISNGIDIAGFQRNEADGSRFRTEHGIPQEAPLIGIVARLDPMKDHRTFLRAAARLAARRKDVRYICVGGGPSPYAEELRRLASSLSLDSLVTWTGTKTDMVGVYSALDILTLPSAFGEGFPNVVGEAMACGVPCVVTNVGDAAWVAGDTGIVVEPCDPAAVAGAWLDLLSKPAEERRTLGSRARERIAQEFSVDALAARTTSAILAVVKQTGGDVHF